MDEIEGLEISLANFAMRASLEGEMCELNHNHNPDEPHPAVNAICQSLGDPDSGEIYQLVMIPICQECEDALLDPNWILLYCLGCGESAWMYRPYARKEYDYHTNVLWFKKCPHCIGETPEE